VSASKDLEEVRSLASQCDPRIQLYQGLKVEFRMDLCNRLITSCQDVVSELQLLVAATTMWIRFTPEPEGRVQRLHQITMDALQNHSRSDIEEVIENRIAGALACLQEVTLSVMGLVPREKDEPLLESSLPILQSLRQMDKLYGNLSNIQNPLVPSTTKTTSATKLAARAASKKCDPPSIPTGELRDEEHLTDNVRLRLVVIVRALERTVYHLGKMGEECLKESVQPQVF